ncbi:Hypothetical protein CINCED_3A011958 [Cinara cedri]|uniref:Uncharacterized protein n=1 Tax=Cinara cedri TaxID=506608 RepID=A0A5E4N427_9HEMI|nr:Hypothetical protein CINCED_3A011958 [Cinara cedri]
MALAVTVTVAVPPPFSHPLRRGDDGWLLLLLLVKTAADGGSGGEWSRRWLCADRRLFRVLLLLAPLTFATTADGHRGTPSSAMTATAGMSMLADRAIGRRADFRGHAKTKQKKNKKIKT